MLNNISTSPIAESRTLAEHAAARHETSGTTRVAGEVFLQQVENIIERSSWSWQSRSVNQLDGTHMSVFDYFYWSEWPIRCNISALDEALWASIVMQLAIVDSSSSSSRRPETSWRHAHNVTVTMILSGTTDSMGSSGQWYGDDNYCGFVWTVTVVLTTQTGCYWLNYRPPTGQLAAITARSATRPNDHPPIERLLMDGPSMFPYSATCATLKDTLPVAATASTRADDRNVSLLYGSRCNIRRLSILTAHVKSKTW